MLRVKKMVAICVVAVMAVLVAAPAVSYALPTSYKGSRTYSSSAGYRSYTYTNGYETGGNVKNTVMAYIGSTSTKKSKTTTGENSIYSTGVSTAKDAYHGIGTGTSVTKTWQAN